MKSKDFAGVTLFWFVVSLLRQLNGFPLLKTTAFSPHPFYVSDTGRTTNFFPPSAAKVFFFVQGMLFSMNGET